jgi:hypothetical protein
MPKRGPLNREAILRAKTDRLLFRADCGLPMGVPPASPFFQAMLRSGESVDRSFADCRIKVSNFLNDEYLGDGAPLWVFLDECTERPSRANPFVSTTTDLEAALKYAQRGSGAYLSIIAPYERSVDFSPELHIGNGRRDREVGIPGVIVAEEIIAQIPVAKLNEENKVIIQRPDTLSQWLENEGREFIYQPRSIFSHSLKCPDCGDPLPVYFHRQVGDNNEAIAKIQLDPRHPDLAFREGLALVRGAAVKCTCQGEPPFELKFLREGEVEEQPPLLNSLYCPQLDSRELITLRKRVFRKEYMEVDLENLYGANIDVLWLWFAGRASSKRTVHQYRLRMRTAETHYRETKMTEHESIEVETALAISDRSIPPGMHERYKLQRDPYRKEFGVFGAHFSDGQIWIPLKHLENRSWDTTGVFEI